MTSQPRLPVDRGDGKLTQPKLFFLFDATGYPPIGVEWHLYNCLTAALAGHWGVGLTAYGIHCFGVSAYVGWQYFPMHGDAVAADLTAALASGSVPQVAGCLYLLFPSSVNAPTGYTGVAGGFHGQLGNGAAYAVIPVGATQIAGPQDQRLNAVTLAASHEMAEAITDTPVGAGIIDTAGPANTEIGDVLNWKPWQFTAQGYSYVVQQYELWDGTPWPDAPFVPAVLPADALPEPPAPGSVAR